MKWIKRHISVKLFMLIAIAYLILIITQFIFNSFYFERFYEDSKYREAQNAMNKFISLIEVSENKANDYAYNLLEKDNILITSVNYDLNNRIGINLDSLTTYLILEDDNNQTYKVQYDQIKPIVSLVEGDKVHIQGITARENNEIIPFLIRSDNGQIHFVGSMNTGSSVDVLTIDDIPQDISVSGRIKEIIDDISNQSLYLRDVALESIFTTFTNNSISDNIEHVVEYQGLKNIVLVRPTAYGVVYVVTTIQAVSELLRVLNSFYTIILIVLAIVCTVLALIISKIISKPLLKLNSYAKRISIQDFDSPISFSREDEIGMLSSSLNTISNNLQKKIGELENDFILQQERNEMEKDLVANISHELKTPLTVIKGYVKGIQSGIYSKDDNSKYENILIEVDDMTNMVSSLLDIFKMESKQSQLDISVFNIWDVTLKEIDRLHSYNNKHPLFKYDYQEEMFVKADEAKISQVIQNLIINAVKYSSKNSEIRIIIKYCNDVVKFEISNECENIESEEIEKIWKPFYRLEKSRNKQHGGTGLGLPIIKSILDKHDFGYGINIEGNNFIIWFELDTP